MCRIGFWQLLPIFLINMDLATCQPKRVQNLLSPEPEVSDKSKLETDYYKPKEYRSRDFPRLVDGLGQQIRRDLDETHSALALHAKQVQHAHERMDRLEHLLPIAPENVHTSNQFLAILCLLLLLSLALLLAANCFMFLFNRIRANPDTLAGHQLLHCAQQ